MGAVNKVFTDASQNTNFGFLTEQEALDMYLNIINAIQSKSKSSTYNIPFVNFNTKMDK